MKKFLKSLMVVALVFTLALTLTGCGDKENTENNGGNTQKQGGSSSNISLEDMSLSNWQDVVKQYWGIDVEVPDGWEVTEAKSYNGKTNANIYFKRNSGITAYEFGTKLYDKTSALVTNGNMNYSRESYTSYADANLTDSDTNIKAYWYYYQYNSKTDMKDLYSLQYSLAGGVIEIALIIY